MSNCYVEFWENKNQESGGYRKLDGPQNYSDLSDVHWKVDGEQEDGWRYEMDDCISSLRTGSQAWVILYTDSDYKGDSVLVGPNTTMNLDDGYDNDVASIKVFDQDPNAQTQTTDDYEYDLVSAITQKMLNDNLKYLLNETGKETGFITTYYKNTDANGAGVAVEMTPEEVQTYIIDNNINIFSIPDGATSDNNETLQTINSWMDIFFMGGFRASVGLPGLVRAGVQEYYYETDENAVSEAFDNAPDILTLRTQSTVDANQTVLYDVYFNSFQVTEISITRTCSCKQYYQDPNSPYQNTYQIDLNIDSMDTSLGNLPDYMQSQLQSVEEDPSTMFSLQQLLLDLNTLALQTGNLQTIVPANSPLGPMFNVFVNEYWLKMTQNGDIVFANALLPEGVTYPEASIVPTAFSFVVSPYIPTGNDSDLSNEEKENLATLNYLIMSENRAMPNPIEPFEWNWIDTTDLEKQVGGRMAIKRDILIDNLSGLLSPMIQDLCYRVDVNSDFGFSDDDKYINILSPSNSYKYRRVNNEDKNYLLFSYYMDQGDQVGAGSSQNSAIFSSVEVNSSVKLVDNEIRIVTSIFMYVSYFVGEISKTYGYPIAQTTETIFQMSSVGASIEEGGKLTLTCTKNQTTQLGQTDSKDEAYYNGDLDPSLYATIFSFGQIGDVFDDLQDEVNSTLGQIRNSQNDIEDYINSNFSFVFPGAQTFFFKNPVFTDKGDLNVELTYQAID